MKAYAEQQTPFHESEKPSRKTIAALTQASGGYTYYPWYISINHEPDGRISVTVRDAEKMSDEGNPSSTTVTAFLSSDEWDSLKDEIAKPIGPTAADAWIQFASAAISGTIAQSVRFEDGMKPDEIVYDSSIIADMMLKECRNRFSANT